jgi:hypothetical protein
VSDVCNELLLLFKLFNAINDATFVLIVVIEHCPFSHRLTATAPDGPRAG